MITKVLSLLGGAICLFTSASAQSLYIKNGTGCSLDIMLRGHSGSAGLSTPCMLGSSMFNIGPSSTMLINDVSDLNCSFCLPVSWIIPSGAPFSPFATGPGMGAGWDAGHVRTSGCTPIPCTFANVGPGCTGVSSTSLPGCPGATVLWVYISVNDSYELTVY